MNRLLLSCLVLVVVLVVTTHSRHLKDGHRIHPLNAARPAQALKLLEENQSKHSLMVLSQHKTGSAWMHSLCAETCRHFNSMFPLEQKVRCPAPRQKEIWTSDVFHLECFSHADGFSMAEEKRSLLSEYEHLNNNHSAVTPPRLRVLIMYRNPYDLVASGYLYHSDAAKTSEGWLLGREQVTWPLLTWSQLIERYEEPEWQTFEGYKGAKFWRAALHSGSAQQGVFWEAARAWPEVRAQGYNVEWCRKQSPSICRVFHFADLKRNTTQFIMDILDFLEPCVEPNPSVLATYVGHLTKPAPKRHTTSDISKTELIRLLKANESIARLFEPLVVHRSKGGRHCGHDEEEHGSGDSDHHRRFHRRRRHNKQAS